MKTIFNNKLNKTIKKGGEAAMKIKLVLSIIVVLSSVLALFPSVVSAADNDNAIGTFGCKNAQPTVSSVALVDLGGSGVTTMTPKIEYNVKVTVSDVNTLDDLTTVKVWIYWDEDGTFNSANKVDPGDTQKGAIFTWTNANPDTWAIDPTGGGTTWVLVTDNCTNPSLAGSNGVFQFHFKPGIVAKESAGLDSEWHIYAEADDGTNPAASNYQENREMAWYGEIDLTTPTEVNWGDIDAGIDFGEPGSVNSSISVTYRANGNYSENVSATSPWSTTANLDPSGLTANANEFSLKADNDATLEDAALVTIYDTFTAIDETGILTGETGNIEGTNSLWIRLSETFVAGTYSGTIYYQIANR